MLDAVICGAGPAGLQCARELARAGKKVLILDKDSQIEQPKKSTAGVPAYLLEEYEIPRKVIMSKNKTFLLQSQNQNAEAKVESYVLEFGKLKKFLAEDAIHNGAELKIATTVTKPVYEHRKLAGVKYKDWECEHTAKARFIIDATGPTSVLAKNILSLTPKNLWTAMEYQVCNAKQKGILIRLDRNIAPHGYAWTFNCGKRHAKIGHCWKSQSKIQAKYLKAWMERYPGTPTEVHSGNAYIYNPKRRSQGNFMAIGDSISSIHPLFGEGIRPGMHSATYAAQAIKQGKPETYEQKWQRHEGRKLASILAHALYRMSNKQYDAFVRKFSKLDQKTISRFVKYDFRITDIKHLLT